VSYSVVDIEALEGSGPGGAVRFVRRRLGVEAFGINWLDLLPNTEGREHDETDSQQEEVNIVIRGTGTYRVDGEELPIRAPMAFRFDPETRRQPVAGPEGLTMIAVGAPRGSYVAHGPF
jgi:hypothetical protein